MGEYRDIITTRKVLKLYLEVMYNQILIQIGKIFVYLSHSTDFFKILIRLSYPDGNRNPSPDPDRSASAAGGEISTC